MESSFNHEVQIWNSIQAGDAERLLESINKKSVVYWQGERYNGDVFAKEVSKIGVNSFSIGCFDVPLNENVTEEENIAQSFYVVNVSIGEKNKNETVSVLSTWKMHEHGGELISAFIEKIA